ncbi:MAG: hypothetical protein AB1779_11600 [Candidatus Thermoplasmatota archaeon]
MPICEKDIEIMVEKRKVEKLIEISLDKYVNKTIRDYAVDFLRGIYRRETIDYCLKFLKKGSVGNQLDAISVLRSIQGEEAIPALKEVIDRAYSEIVSTDIKQHQKDSSFVPVKAESLYYNALMCVAEIQQQNAIKYLIDMYKNNSLAREAIINAFKCIKKPETISALETLKNGEYGYSKELIVKALYDMKRLLGKNRNIS